VDIFISYAREDLGCAEFVERILKEQGWEVWRDERSITPGTRYARQILNAADEARCLIVLWSQSSIASAWVKREASQAFRNETIVPLSIDGTKPPNRHKAIHWLNFVGWEGLAEIDTEVETHDSLERLVAAVSYKLGENTLKEMLYWYLVQHQNTWCWPTNIKNDSSLWLRFEPIANHRVSEIREELGLLADEGHVLGRDGGAYGYF
jgi:hypothetical protein